MRIVVCCRAVPKGVSNIRFNETEGRVDYESDSRAMNDSDACALEEALALKKEAGGEITVIAMGNLKCQEMLHQALAKGADRAVRIDADVADSAMTSRALAEAIKPVGYDLVLTGVESSDTLSAQTGVALAERLGIPYAFAVTKVEIEQGLIKATKELGQGVKEVLKMPLPALLCVESGVRPISYALLTKLMQARKVPVRSVALESLGINRDAEAAKGWKIVGVLVPVRAGACEMIEGKIPEIVRELKRKIDNALQ
jgi:electron transfer flavoprotein beta subunit